MSPVEIAGIANQFVISRDCVPLPLPGGPKSRRTTLLFPHENTQTPC
jgi:hypothetical protein